MTRAPAVATTCSALLLALLTMRPLAAAPQRPSSTSSASSTAPDRARWMPVPQSQIETLLASPDALFVTDLARVTDPAVSNLGIVIDAVVVTERSPTPGSARGIRITVSDGAKADRTATSYVDGDEIEGLSQATGQMIDVAAAWTTREGARAVEAQFATVDGFAVGFRQDTQNQRAFVAAGFLDPVRRSFSVADLTTIKAAIDEAAAMLQAK